MRARRHRDGVVGRPRPRHRSDPRVRRVHRGGAPRLHPDLRRRSREDGRRRAGRRRPRRRHRRRQHGLPRSEDREAQRRLQPDARARARGDRHQRDGEGGEDSGDGQDARRLERSYAECARPCAPSSRRRRRGGDDPRAHGGAVVQRIGGLGSRVRRRARSLDTRTR